MKIDQIVPREDADESLKTLLKEKKVSYEALALRSQGKGKVAGST